MPMNTPNTCKQAWNRELETATTAYSVWIVKKELGVHRGNLRGVPVPHFLDWGVLYPNFSGQKGEEFAVTRVVNRGDLRRLNYNKIVFGRGSAVRAHDTLSDPRVGWGGDTSSPFSSSLASGLKGASFSFKFVPPLFSPKLRPCGSVEVKGTGG